METSDQQLREDLLQKLVDARLMGPSAQLCFNQDPSQLPMRELPHGNYASVCLLYAAYSRAMNEKVAGKTLFYKCAEPWKKCLKFNKKTVHAICSTCAKLKAKIQKCRDT